MKLEHWQRCHNAYVEWMRLEAADRGYDAKAATAARLELDRAKMFYMVVYGERWVPST